MQEIDNTSPASSGCWDDQFTVCDPYALVFYSWGGRVGLPMADLKNYTAHKDRLLKRPAVQKVLQREESPAPESGVMRGAAVGSQPSRRYFLPLMLGAALTAREAAPSQSLAGQLLIAAPSIGDPRFEQTGFSW